MCNDLGAKTVRYFQSCQSFAPAPSIDGNHSMEQVLLKLRPEALLEDQRTILEQMCKKVEVGKAVWALYDEKWKPCKEAGKIDNKFLDILAAAYLHYGLFFRDWKWLNTALKMEDGILQKEGFIPSPHLSALLNSMVSGGYESS